MPEQRRVPVGTCGYPHGLNDEPALELSGNYRRSLMRGVINNIRDFIVSLRGDTGRVPAVDWFCVTPTRNRSFLHLDDGSYHLIRSLMIRRVTVGWRRDFPES